MPTSSTPSQLTFVDYEKPPLEDGDYVLTVQQQVQIDGAYGWGTDPDHRWAGAPTATLNVSVAGPRFALDPGDVDSQFPPPGSLGEYDNVLPHVVLTRTTIAWERSIDATVSSTTAEAPPWLALLLFDATADGGAPTVTNLTVQDLMTAYATSATPSGQPEFCRVLPRGTTTGIGAGDLVLETGQHPGDRLTVIDVPRQLLWQILPSETDLPLMAHVRRGQSAADPTLSADYPVVFGNRLPSPGTSSVGSQSTVHLVSLESRKPLLDALATATEPTDDGLVRLVSLASWSFSTMQESQTFATRVKAAWCPDASRTDPGSLAGTSTCAAVVVHTLRMPVSANADAERLLGAGYAPLRHQTRQGNQLVSWYRGPLLPGPAPAQTLPLPVVSSDPLLRYWSDVGMMDTSYAAAWELGRALTLRGKAGVSLFNWKRAHAQQALQAQQSVAHLPFAPAAGTPPGLPDDVATWFLELVLLQNVPFHYLVPRQEMLPPESLRFFTVDPAWVQCLLDGAFSVGRVSTADLARDQSHTDGGVLPTPPVYGGFLLRSQAVSGWPQLGVEGYADAVPAGTADPGDYAFTGGPATLLRMDRLAPDLLLCLFDGDVQTVDVHEHPDVVHFGVDRDDASDIGSYYKDLRTITGQMGGTVVKPLPWRNGSSGKRTLDMTAMAAVQAAAGAADFAVMMIEGVERVRFMRAAS